LIISTGPCRPRRRSPPGAIPTRRPQAWLSPSRPPPSGWPGGRTDLVHPQERLHTLSCGWQYLSQREVCT